MNRKSKDFDRISVQNLEKGEKSAINTVFGEIISKFRSISSYMDFKYVYLNIKYVYMDVMSSYLEFKYVYMNIKYAYLEVISSYMNIIFSYMNLISSYLKSNSEEMGSKNCIQKRLII